MKTNPLKFETILVVTDLEGNNSLALRYGQAIASQYESTLVILHLIDPVRYAFPTDDPQFLKEDIEARNELKRIEDDVHFSGATVHSVVESGAICDSILQSVKDHNADLLILGTKSKSGVGRVALGTIVRQLLARCLCPILTVPQEAESLSSMAGSWRRVLVATDFSAASLAALQYAHTIVRGQLLVLHASSPVNKRECTKCLERLRFLAPLNESHTVPVEHVADVGNVSKLISRHALSFKSDLIVLGAPSSELSSEELNSSTVLEVVSEAACPVLCVPATETASCLGSLKEEVPA